MTLPRLGLFAKVVFTLCAIAAFSTGLALLLQHRSAMIVEPPDAAAFAEAMARVERDGPLRHDLGRRGRERAASARWEDSAARLVAVLAEAVG